MANKFFEELSRCLRKKEIESANYPVEDGAEYPIRIYTVAMADDEEQGNLVVTNIGHLFES